MVIERRSISRLGPGLLGSIHQQYRTCVLFVEGAGFMSGRAAILANDSVRGNAAALPGSGLTPHPPAHPWS